jgi:HEPN domain-containing protein
MKETDWQELAQDDYDTFLVMISNKRYRAIVVYAQQSVEKILKAYISNSLHKQPPKSHFLEKLVQLAQLDIA